MIIKCWKLVEKKEKEFRKKVIKWAKWKVEENINDI